MTYQDYKEAKAKTGMNSVKKALLLQLKELESDLQHMVVLGDGSKFAQKEKIVEVKKQLDDCVK